MVRKGHRVAYGAPLTDKYLPESFSAEDPGGYACCWRWLGAINSSGYGQVRVDGQVIGAHIAVYDALAESLGLPPRPRERDGRGKLRKEFHHTCDNNWCVNPFHCKWVKRRDHRSEGGKRRHGVPVTL